MSLFQNIKTKSEKQYEAKWLAYAETGHSHHIEH